jgi:type IX secretion system PorP/SprF family membrane protein
MPRLLLYLTFILLGIEAYSQQLPLFSQNREYWSYINPAMLNGDYFTYEYNWSFGANYRHQWANQEFTPRTAYARGEYFSNGQGFSFIGGGYLMHDQVGPTGFTGAYARLAGVIGRDPRDGALSIGFTAGMVRHYLKGSQVRLQNPNDILNGQDFNQTIPDIGVGIAFHRRLGGYGTRGDVIYGGLSIPQLFNFDLTYRSDNGEFDVRRQRHYFANLGYYKTVRDQFFEVAAWAKYVEGNPIHIDVYGRYQPIPYFWIEMGLSSALQIRPALG